MIAVLDEYLPRAASSVFSFVIVGGCAVHARACAASACFSCARACRALEAERGHDVASDGAGSGLAGTC